MEISYNQPSITITLDKQSSGLPAEIIIRADPESENPNIWVYKCVKTINEEDE